MEPEHRIMVGQGAVMFAVLFMLAWHGGVHWLLAALIGILLMPPVLMAVDGVRYYVESREKRREEGEAEAEQGKEHAAE